MKDLLNTRNGEEADQLGIEGADREFFGERERRIPQDAADRRALQTGRDRQRDDIARALGISPREAAVGLQSLLSLLRYGVMSEQVPSVLFPHLDAVARVLRGEREKYSDRGDAQGDHSGSNATPLQAALSMWGPVLELLPGKAERVRFESELNAAATRISAPPLKTNRDPSGATLASSPAERQRVSGAADVSPDSGKPALTALDAQLPALEATFIQLEAGLAAIAAAEQRRAAKTPTPREIKTIQMGDFSVEVFADMVSDKAISQRTAATFIDIGRQRIANYRSMRAAMARDSLAGPDIHRGSTKSSADADEAAVTFNSAVDDSLQVIGYLADSAPSPAMAALKSRAEDQRSALLSGLSSADTADVIAVLGVAGSLTAMCNGNEAAKEAPNAIEPPSTSRQSVQPGFTDGARTNNESTANSLPVQPVDRDSAVEDIAETGFTGAPSALPHGDVIQEAFGNHSLSGVTAYVGGTASTAASKLGATAYASGQRIAFSQSPDLHTSAHEAAHVIQQNAGIARKGLDGGGSDPLEAHADAVADAVVRGESAQSLLGQHLAAPAVSAGAFVQRKGPASHGTAKPKDVVPHSVAGVARLLSDADYRPTWEDVVAASNNDPFAKGVLDVDWIANLSPQLLQQIDGTFHVDKRNAAFELAKKLDKKTRDLKSEHDKATTALKRAQKGSKKSPGINNADYETEQQGLDERFKDDTAARKTEVTAEFDSKLKKFSASRSAVAAPKEGVTWAQGQLLARINFMAWGINVLGSADAVKAHFSGIRAVSGIGSSGNNSQLHLAASAAARLEQTRAWFEQQFPGYRMLDSTVGQAIRGRHQAEHSRGKQGHPLGISVDFAATVNVHQKDPVGKFMLKEFGGAEGTKGTTSMDLGSGSHDAVKQLGMDTVANRALSEKQEQFLASAHESFVDMAASSARFQALLGDKMVALNELRQVYYSQVAPSRQRLSALDKQIAQESKKTKKAAPQEATASNDRSPAEQERETLAAELTLVESKIETMLSTIFAPMIERLNTQILEHSKDFTEEEMGNPVDVKKATAAVKAISSVTTKLGTKKLKNVAARKENRAIFASFTADLDALSFEEAKQQLLSHADRIQAAKWANGEVSARRELLRRFTDLHAVFGTGVLKTDKKTKEQSWSPKREVADPSIMQYLETGYVRNDEMPDRDDGRGRQAVFNGRFIQAMMRHGWSPGAAWSSTTDTMHFDFEEGYDLIKGTSKKFGPTD